MRRSKIDMIYAATHLISEVFKAFKALFDAIIRLKFSKIDLSILKIIHNNSTGLTIQCVMPGYVVSNMSKIRRANFMAPMPDQFVKSALAKLGVESRTTGYWVHDIMLFGQTK